MDPEPNRPPVQAHDKANVNVMIEPNEKKKSSTAKSTDQSTDQSTDKPTDKPIDTPTSAKHAASSSNISSHQSTDNPSNEHTRRSGEPPQEFWDAYDEVLNQLRRAEAARASGLPENNDAFNRATDHFATIANEGGWALTGDAAEKAMDIFEEIARIVGRGMRR